MDNIRRQHQTKGGSDSSTTGRPAFATTVLQGMKARTETAYPVPIEYLRLLKPVTTSGHASDTACGKACWTGLPNHGRVDKSMAAVGADLKCRIPMSHLGYAKERRAEIWASGSHGGSQKARPDDGGTTPEEDRSVVCKAGSHLERRARRGLRGPSASRAPGPGMTFADASFLVSLFARDENGPKAWKWFQEANAILIASRLVYFEAENSIRALVVAGKCKAQKANNALEEMKRARLEGIIELREIPVRRLYPAAHRLSVYHTLERTFGAMDIIHVATALELGAKTFVSFDTRQRELAEAEGLVVAP